MRKIKTMCAAVMCVAAVAAVGSSTASAYLVSSGTGHLGGYALHNQVFEGGASPYKWKIACKKAQYNGYLEVGSHPYNLPPLTVSYSNCEINALNGLATGFVFERFDPDALKAAIRRAFALHARSHDWRDTRTRAMQQDFGWAASAQRYLALYREML